MSEESPQQPAPRPSWTSPWSWPWGQLCGFLLGLSFFIIGMETLIVFLAIYFRLMSPRPGDQTSLLQGLAVLSMLGAMTCGILALLFRVWRFLRRLPPPVRLPWLGKSGAALFVIGLLSHTIALLLPAMVKAQMAQQQAVAAGPWREHAFADGVIRLSTPPNWEVVPNPNAPASSIYMVDRQNDSSLSAVLVPKQDLAVQSLNELAQQSAASLSEKLIDPSSTELLPGELGGRPTIDVVQGGHTPRGEPHVVYALHRVPPSLAGATDVDHSQPL